MSITPLQSLVATGTKLWLDSVDPDETVTNRQYGATGATSNPIIIADIIKTSRFDARNRCSRRDGLNDHDIAWRLDDQLVRQAQEVFLPAWEQSKGDDGYVSFELDPLLEDTAVSISAKDRTAKYIDLGKKWSRGHKNRMIKVPATPNGLAALEDLCAAGVTLNITLVFSDDQYRATRDAMWRGAQKRPSLENFKSVYTASSSAGSMSTRRKCRRLWRREDMISVVNAKHIWREYGVLGRQEDSAPAGDDLRQHGHEEA